MNNLKAYLLIGCPCSGKSTWGKELVKTDPNIARLCPDEFRAIFGTSESDQSVSAKAFDATRQGMHSALVNKKDVVIDATNMYKKTRKDFLSIAKMYNATTIAVVFEVTRETAIERNKKRVDEGGRNVPEHIIDSMLAKYQRPDELEFDKVVFINKI